MQSVQDLPHTTFSGRRFTRRQLAQVQETVSMFPNLGRRELAETVCVHLKWATHKGSNKVLSCLSMLEKLEDQGLIVLPKKEIRGPRPRHKLHPPRQREEELPIQMSLAELGPITLERVIADDDRREFKGYIDAYHYLGYKHPVGSHICYFIVATKTKTRLGCLLFTASAAWVLKPRDEWIGWPASIREKQLHLILSNNRFLLFPWVQVPHLASKALSQAVAQIGDDWLLVHKYRPVLIETFVDKSKYQGTCYQAANWHHLGESTGRGRLGSHHKAEDKKKDIYVMPLSANWREQLHNTQTQKRAQKQYRNDLKASHTRIVDDSFVVLWEKVVHLMHEVAAAYDERWQVRHRVLNSLFVMLLIFRLVTAKNKQSYGTTIDELWDSCRRLNLSLPQKTAVAPSAFCEARKKLDPRVFYDLNQKILAAYAPRNDLWLGHRLFAVDGTKINVPRPLEKQGYRVPSKNAHYPQGLVSTLYALNTKLPIDFDLVSHSNERQCVEQHLKVLMPQDVVVYDRGYFSYAMLHRHLDMGIHAIFRLQESSYSEIRDFSKSSETDKIITLLPEGGTKSHILRAYPGLNIKPLDLRLIKYSVDDETFCLGTTLMETAGYPANIFPDVYHQRWGIEELYKVSKQLIQVEDFHSCTEHGVKQELFAHFALITMNRLFINHIEHDKNGDMNQDAQIRHSMVRRVQVNVKNALHTFAAYMEPLLLLHKRWTDTIADVFQRMAGRTQKSRPERSYPRRSMRPESKWRSAARSKKGGLLRLTVAN